MDRSVEKELEALNKRFETMLDIVLEHFGDNADRFDVLEEKLKALKPETSNTVVPQPRSAREEQFGDWENASGF